MTEATGGSCGVNGRFAPLALVHVGRSPPPFMEIGQGGRHRSFHMIPWALSLMQLVPESDPGLLNVVAVVCRPMGDEALMCWMITTWSPGSANLALTWS